MRKNKIIISMIGAYGTNTGDNAILLGILCQLNTVLSKFPDRVLVYILTNYPDYLSKFLAPMLYYLNLEIKFLKITKLDELLRALLFSDVVIWGGGGLIVDDWHPIYSSAYLIPIVIARVLRKKVIVYSIGASIPKSHLGKLLTKIALSLADKITVRDIDSMKALRSIGISKEIELCYDPAIVLETSSLTAVTKESYSWIRSIKSKSKNYIVILSLRYIFKYSKNVPDHKYLISELITFINTIIEKYNAIVIFVPFNRHPTKWFENDSIIAELIKKGVKYKDRFILINDISNIENIMAIINQADVLIGARLHSLILGIISDVPVIGIVSDKKIYNFMKMLGLESFLIYPGEPMLHLKLLRLFEKILVNRNCIVREIQRRRKLIKLMTERKCAHILQYNILHEDKAVNGVTS